MYKSNAPDNFAAWSLYPQLKNIDESNSTVIDIREAKSAINSIGIKDFDLIKIDAEGAEYPIIKSNQSLDLDTSCFFAKQAYILSLVCNTN